MMIELRRARSEDVPAMAAIVSAWEQGTGWMPVTASLPEIETMIGEALPNREIWVAGDPVAAYLSFDPETAKVGGLYSKTPGAGLGKVLMDRVKQGREYIWLNTHEPNLAAQRFYAREGFVEVARFDPDPPDTVREIKLEWRA